MKKFIINIGLFSVFSILFYVIVMPLWSSFLPFYMSKNVRSCMGCYGHTFTRMQDAKKTTDVDVLIVGSSHAYRGIDPRVLKEYGITAFNLGSSAQTPINTKILLHQYLDQIKPKMVIYEAYAGTLGIDGVESSLDLLSNNQIDYNSIKMTNEVHNLLAYNTLIFSGFRQTFGLNKNFKEAIIQGDDTYISPTGYVETKFRKNILKDESVNNWKLYETQKRDFIDNINYIKSKDIDVYIIQAPITQKLYNSKLNHKEVDTFLGNLSDYKNYQGKLILNDTIDFYDSNHMNHNAVKIFSELLARDVNLIFKKNDRSIN